MRTAGVPAAAVFALVHLAEVTDLLSPASRGLVILTAKALRIPATVEGTDLVLGTLALPWTRDCSGINVLILLLATTLWIRRNAPSIRGTLVRLVACIPAALGANVIRILALAAYRKVFFPDWEGLQLHYFIGFACALPFLALLTGRLREITPAHVAEVMHVAAVLSLLLPVVPTPGGSIVAVCALFFVARNRFRPGKGRLRAAAYAAWLLVAAAIGRAGMESLWIPWLLLCPGFANPRDARSPTAWIVLSGSVSLLALHRPWQLAVVVALVVRGALALRAGQKEKRAQTEALQARPRTPEACALTIMVLAPFVLPGILGAERVAEAPPPGLMVRRLGPATYAVRLPGQPADIDMYWYGAQGGGRHHTLPVCMRFRGIHLKRDATVRDVFVGNDRWMKEYFLVRQRLRDSYPAYLMATVSPFSPPGVHIIFEAPRSSMDAAFFADRATRLTEGLVNAVQGTPETP